MNSEGEKKQVPSGFSLICVLGAPGAGKGTLCSFLAQKYSLYHFSIGDHLRQLVREFPDGHLAVKIQSILKDQTSLPFEDIKVLLEHALEHAMSQGKFKGILLDGYPRYMDQVQPFNAWLEENVDYGPLAKIGARRRPDLVLRFDVAKEVALKRYLSRAREPTDNETLFERRYAVYERETLEVFEEYNRRGILIWPMSVNGTVQENTDTLVERLEANLMWQAIVMNARVWAHDEEASVPTLLGEDDGQDVKKLEWYR